MILNTPETNVANAKKNSSIRVSQIALEQERTGKSKTQVKREMKARDKALAKKKRQ